MSASSYRRRIVQTAGEAVGRISGINHLVLFVRRLDEAVVFYRDVLGLRVVRTVRFEASAQGVRAGAGHSAGAAADAADEAIGGVETFRQVFFELGNGELFSVYQGASVSATPDASIVSFLWPPLPADRVTVPRHPQKLDHLSFDVPTREDLEWFRRHLARNGVPVSDVVERRGAQSRHRFIASIYFHDPSANPLEIATFDRGDVEWRGYDHDDWFTDDDPVPSLLGAPDFVHAPWTPVGLSAKG